MAVATGVGGSGVGVGAKGVGSGGGSTTGAAGFGAGAGGGAGAGAGGGGGPDGGATGLNAMGAGEESRASELSETSQLAVCPTPASIASLAPENWQLSDRPKKRTEVNTMIATSTTIMMYSPRPWPEQSESAW